MVGLDVQRGPLAGTSDLVVVHRELFPVRACAPADVAEEEETLEMENELVELLEVRGCPHGEISALGPKSCLNTS